MSCQLLNTAVEFQSADLEVSLNIIMVGGIRKCAKEQNLSSFRLKPINLISKN